MLTINKFFYMGIIIVLSWGILAGCMAQKPADTQDDVTPTAMITPKFDEVQDFSEGLAAVRIEDKWGYINKKGDMIIDPEFIYARPFKSGKAFVNTEKMQPGYIDRKGSFTPVDKVKSSNILTFSEGLCAIQVVGKGYGFVDEDDNKVITPEFDYADNFSEGLASVKVNGNFGYINTKGKYIIKPIYEAALPFSEALAGVKTKPDNLWGFINRKGAFVVQPTYDYVQGFSEGLAPVNENGNWGFINTKGEMVIKPQYKQVKRFSEDLAPVLVDSKWGFINKSGEIVVEPVYEAVELFSGALARVKLDGKWGYIIITSQ